MSRIDKKQPIRPRRKSTRELCSLDPSDHQRFREWQAQRQQQEQVQQTIAILETCDRATRLKIFDWLTDNIEKE